MCESQRRYTVLNNTLKIIATVKHFPNFAGAVNPAPEFVGAVKAIEWISLSL